MSNSSTAVMGHLLPLSDLAPILVWSPGLRIFFYQGSFVGTAYTLVGVDFRRFSMSLFSFNGHSSYSSSSCFACLRLRCAALAIFCTNGIMLRAYSSITIEMHTPNQSGLMSCEHQISTDGQKKLKETKREVVVVVVVVRAPGA